MAEMPQWWVEATTRYRRYLVARGPGSLWFESQCAAHAQYDLPRSLSALKVMVRALRRIDEEAWDVSPSQIRAWASDALAAIWGEDAETDT